MIEKRQYSVGIYTLGCKVSLYESEAVSEAFSEAGFTVLPFDEVCDVYVINTCTVTAESDAKSRKYIRRAVRKNPEAAVIVMGCYSQRAPEEAARIPGVSAVIGTADKLSAVRLAREILDRRGAGERDILPIVSAGSLEGAEFEEMSIKRAPRTRAYVKIEDGCDCRCTYCAISAARGPVRSRRPEQVIDEVKTLYGGGTREIVLTGIETGSYGADFDEKYSLSDLVSAIDGLGLDLRIRLGSMAPELMGEKFAMGISGLSVMVPHFHISMQSGSDAVLRGMKRRYNRAQALANIQRIRGLMPGVMFTADLMVGFPGESEEDFLDTVNFVREAGLLDAHVFAYSKREGTPAAEYADQVDECVKRQRSARLSAAVREVQSEILSEVVRRGEALSCIFESRSGGVYTAHSDSYIEVRAHSDRDIRGEKLLVIPERHEDGIIYGKVLEKTT